MFWLSTSTVVRLRDQLRAAGQKASIEVREPTPMDADGLAVLQAEYGPFCEAMYLMMSADGEGHDRGARGPHGRAPQSLGWGAPRGRHRGAPRRRGRERDEHGRKRTHARRDRELRATRRAPRWRSCWPRPSPSPTTRSPTKRTTRSNALAEGLGIDEARADELSTAWKRTSPGLRPATRR